VLTLAGQQADVVNISLASGEKADDAAPRATMEHFERCVGWVRAGAGDRFASLELQTMATVMVAPSHRAAVRSATMLGFSEESLDLPILLFGTEDELCERLVERREKWGYNNIVIPADSMSVFAPIVARLSGT
jgi:hypothetical protein